MLYAFTDAGGGYYQTEVEDGQDFPAWTVGLTSCPVHEPAQDPKQLIRGQIDALERQQIMPRATREFMLLFMESNATPEVLAANPGYQAVKAFDDQIKALRAFL
jgi:hypothetical protein